MVSILSDKMSICKKYISINFFSSEETHHDYILREFLVSKSNNATKEEERKIFHYHFQAWPDHGVPGDPGCVLNFLHDVNLKTGIVFFRLG